MENAYAFALILSNVLIVAIVLGGLWFARSEWRRQQQKMMARLDEVMAEVETWEKWRLVHEEAAFNQLKYLNATHESTVTHTAQIAMIDKRVTRWEDRELGKKSATEH